MRRSWPASWESLFEELSIFPIKIWRLVSWGSVVNLVGKLGDFANKMRVANFGWSLLEKSIFGQPSLTCWAVCKSTKICWENKEFCQQNGPCRPVTRVCWTCLGNMRILPTKWCCPAGGEACWKNWCSANKVLQVPQCVSMLKFVGKFKTFANKVFAADSSGAVVNIVGKLDDFANQIVVATFQWTLLGKLIFSQQSVEGESIC